MAMKLDIDLLQKASVSEHLGARSLMSVLIVTGNKKLPARNDIPHGFEIIDVLSVKGKVATVRTRSDGNAESEQIEWLPANCLAVVEDGSNPALTAQVKRWLGGASPEGVPIIDLSEDAGQLTELLVRRCESVLVRNAQLARDLAVLRGVHEETQNAYNTLRTYIQHNGLHLPQLSFLNTPNDAYEATPGNARIIQQELPLPSRDIAAIGVYVSEKPDRRAQGTVTFRLVAVEGQEVLSTWTIPLSRLPGGLISLIMEKVSFYSRKTAHLLITIEESGGFAGPEFAVGAAQPRIDKRVRVDGALRESSLAFCLWRALPGTYAQATHAMGHVISPVPTKHSPAVAAPGQAAGQAASKGPRVLKAARSQDIFLDLSAPIELIDVFEVQKQHKEVMLQVNAEKGRILVHPHSDGPTVGRLRNVCRPGMRSISAEVFVAHEQAGPVEFALALAKGDRFDADGLSADDPHSGWIQVGPTDVATLRIDLPALLEEPYDLFLCTRLPAGGKKDFALAQFRRVIFSGSFGL